ncbi:MAG: hypothetical protein AAF442_05580 [Pseudomonadota bacterium]
MRKIYILYGLIGVLLLFIGLGLAAWGAVVHIAIPRALNQAQEDMHQQGHQLTYQGFTVEGFLRPHIQVRSWQVITDQAEVIGGETQVTIQPFPPWQVAPLHVTKITIQAEGKTYTADDLKVELTDLIEMDPFTATWQITGQSLGAGFVTIDRARMDIRQTEERIHELALRLNAPTFLDVPIQLGISEVQLTATSAQGVPIQGRHQWQTNDVKITGSILGSEGELMISGEAAMDDLVTGELTLRGDVSRRWHGLLSFSIEKAITSVTNFLLGSADRESRLAINQTVRLDEEGIFLGDQWISDFVLRLR